MKTIILLLLSSLLVGAAPVTFEWDPGDPNETISHYTLWKKQADGAWIVLGATIGPVREITVEFSSGPHTVAVKAHSNEGLTSDLSDPVVFTLPAKPGKPRIKLTLQSSSDLQTWKEEEFFMVAASEGRSFYRAEITIAP